MVLHGRRKEDQQQLTQEMVERKKAAANEWAALWSELIRLRDENRLGDRAIELSEKLIAKNPECYTLWNVRRRAMLHKLAQEEEEEENEEEKEKNEEGSKEPEKEDLPSGDQKQDTEKCTEVQEGEQTLPEQQSSNNDEKEGGKESVGEEGQVTTTKTEAEQKKSKWGFQQKVDMLEKDLSTLTYFGIAHYPKSYWVWHHRLWCVLQMQALLLTRPQTQEEEPAAAANAEAKKQEKRDPLWYWKRELKLCAKFLKADARNFHCWNYRRFVLEHAQTSEQEELEFTEMQISDSASVFFGVKGGGGMNSISNYSAYHQRSLVIGKKLARIAKESPKENLVQTVMDTLQTEFDLVSPAMVMHDGESPWLYHRWLISQVPTSEKVAILEREVELCDEILSSDEEIATTAAPAKWPLLSKVMLLEELRTLLLANNPTEGATFEREKDIKEGLETLQVVDPFRKQFYLHMLHRSNRH
ncbi:Rab geranylgeranyltransferase [Balamuthia mandrillaris]